MRYLCWKALILIACILGGQHAFATSVTACLKITHPGNYVVTQNITVSATSVFTPLPWLGNGYVGCIVIASDFVTLDLGGHTLTGTRLVGTVGIADDSSSRQGNVVHSGAVTDFYYGVALAGTNNSVEDIRSSSNNETGIFLYSAGPNRIYHNIASNNGIYGIDVYGCSSLLVENLAHGNPYADIMEEAGSCNTRQENSPAP